MKIVIGVPTGQRGKQAEKAIASWKKRGFDVCVRTWDIDLTPYKEADTVFQTKTRESFAVNQNAMMDTDWDVWICGADDLWPGEQLDLHERIEVISEEAGNRLLWVGDGLFNQQPTHPIITREMYDDQGGVIFDEAYIHNFVDTDLFARMLVKKKVAKCPHICFDHRHYYTQKTKEDEISLIGSQSYPEDAVLFHKKWGDLTINTIADVEILEIEEEA